MSKTCAYCGAVGPFTKEHVWPDCFLSRVGRGKAHFSHQSKKVHGADYVVGDVCATCNNVKLSPLDAYFCDLYDRFFHRLADFDTSVRFEYDFELLARSLFKIAFNSARSANSSCRPVRRLIPGILGEMPMNGQCSVVAELVRPTLLSDDSEPEGARKLLPEMYRSALTRLLTPIGDVIHSRIVAVNSYYFHLLVPRFAGEEQLVDIAADEVIQHVRGTVRLPHDAGSVTLRTSDQDGVSSFIPHILENIDEYSRFFRSADLRRPGA